MGAPTAGSVTETRHEPLTPYHDRASVTHARAMSRAQWQRLTLPIMMGVLIVAMTAFLVLSFVQGMFVRRQIENAPQLDITPVLASVSCADAAATADVRARCLEWTVAVMLEQHTINRRYHQANVALLVRVTVKYLGFLTGMLMSLVGAVFVLGRLTEASSKLAADGVFGKFTIATVSPGLILALLGTVLMLTTVLSNPPTDVSDGNVYLNPPPASAAR